MCKQVVVYRAWTKLQTTAKAMTRWQFIVAEPLGSKTTYIEGQKTQKRNVYLSRLMSEHSDQEQTTVW